MEGDPLDPIDSEDGLGYNIRVPPPFRSCDFKQWRSRMEYFIIMGIDSGLSSWMNLKPQRIEKEYSLRKINFTRSKHKNIEANGKLINLLINVLPNIIVYRLGKYKSAQEL